MRTIATPTTMHNYVSTLPAAFPPPGSHPSGCRQTAPRPCPSGCAYRAGVPCALGLVPPRVFVTQDHFDYLLVLRYSRRAHGHFFILGDPIYDFGRAFLEGGRDPIHPCVVESKLPLPMRCLSVAPWFRMRVSARSLRNSLA